MVAWLAGGGPYSFLVGWGLPPLGFISSREASVLVAAVLQCLPGILGERFFPTQLAWFCVPTMPHVLAMLAAFLTCHGLLVTDAVGYSLTLRAHAFMALMAACRDSSFVIIVCVPLTRSQLLAVVAASRVCVAAGWLVTAFRTRLRYMQYMAAGKAAGGHAAASSPGARAKED